MLNYGKASVQETDNVLCDGVGKADDITEDSGVYILKVAFQEAVTYPMHVPVLL